VTEGPDRPRAGIRIAGPGDAAALLRLKQCLDLETAFMLLEPDGHAADRARLEVIDAIPKSASGKILRRVLRDAAAQPSA
jgi:acyl-coenzyme A synthetase/AMP-(fatty) acid ligase